MVETRRSSILGPDGQPIEVPLLKGETAAPERYGARAIVYYSEASGLTPPKLAQIMQSANMGLAKPYLTLAIDMEERYTHYASQLQTRRLALDGVTTSVSAPKGVDAKAVDFVESLINDPKFVNVVAALQDGVGKGYSVVEPIWEYQEGALRPVLYEHRDPRYFRYDEIGLSKLCLLEDSGLPGEEIKPPYFVKHEPWLRAGPPIRRGVARPAAWAFVMQTFALQDWAAFCEIYGIPFRIGKYHPSATNEDKQTLLRAVRSISNDAAAIIPEGMAIDFQETNGNRGEAVFGNFITYLDNKVSLIILGQTMTAEVSKSGGSLAQAQVQENVRMDIVRFDARQQAMTINRDLIQYAVAMNFGPQEVYPTVEMELAENDDLDALGNFLDKTVSQGLKVGQKFVRQKASIPEPEADEELLVPRSGADVGAKDQPSNSEKRPKDDAAAARKRADSKNKAGEKPDALASFGRACPSCGEVHSARFAAQGVDDDPAGEIATEAASDWEPQLAPIVDAVIKASEESGSYEEFRTKLAALAGDMDTGLLMQRLAVAQMKARAAGNSSNGGS